MYKEDFLVTVSFEIGTRDYGFPDEVSAKMFARGAVCGGAVVSVWRWDFDMYVRVCFDPDMSLYRV